MTAPIHGQQGEEYALLTAMIKSRAEEHLTYQVPNTPKPAPLLQLCNQTQTSLLSEETTWTSYMHQVMPRLTSLNASELQLVVCRTNCPTMPVAGISAYVLVRVTCDPGSQLALALTGTSGTCYRRSMASIGLRQLVLVRLFKFEMSLLTV